MRRVCEYRNGSEANEVIEASRDGSLTSNLLTTPSATPLTAMRTPLARVGVSEVCEC